MTELLQPLEVIDTITHLWEVIDTIIHPQGVIGTITHLWELTDTHSDLKEKRKHNLFSAHIFKKK